MRRLAGILCLVTLACGAAGCSSMGLGKSFGKNEQWEPPVEEGIPKPPRNSASALRAGKDQESTENAIDKLIWSDTARDINRNLGGSL
ncbi:MAG: hypothetical protein JSS49_06820 [Planctomycetes bacterium]|nr:hypothetical protein [Planctomycetota bacterium]